MNNSFRTAQHAHEMRDDPNMSADFNEPDDDHEAQAIAELGDDPGALWDVLEASAWYKEHCMFLFAHSPAFRAEVLAANDQRIKDRAQELADMEAKSRDEEAALDRGGWL